MKYSGLTIAEIRELVTLGNRCKNDGVSLENTFEYLQNSGWNPGNSGVYNVFELAYNGKLSESDVREKVWYRIGEPILSEYGGYRPSWNFADEHFENGVSTISSRWLKSMKSIFFGVYESVENGNVWKIKGVQVGIGGDDEPVILPTDWAEQTDIRDVETLREIVTKQEASQNG